MAKCEKCNDTGVEETGNNDLPCSCPLGETALFNRAGVIGPVTGAELKRHFLNGAPEPLNTSRDLWRAEDLPGRKVRGDWCAQRPATHGNAKENTNA